MIFNPGDINMERAMLVELEHRQFDINREFQLAIENAHLSRDRQFQDVRMWIDSQMFHLHLLLSRFGLTSQDIQHLEYMRGEYGQ